MKELTREWRIWVLLLSLGISLFFLGPHYVQQDGEWTIETGINKGLDLQGGTRVLLSVQGNNTSEAQVNQIKNILERRVSAFGLTQTSVRTVRLGDEFNIQMEIASTNQSQLRDLISQEGRFEARLPLKVEDEKNFSIQNSYTFRKTSEGVEVAGESYEAGDRFTLDNAEFFYINDTENGVANLEVAAYTGEDVQQVLTSDSRVMASGGQGYSFTFPVVITSEAAERVTQISQNYDVSSSAGGDPYLVLEDGSFAELKLYVDGRMQSSLRVGAVFKQQEITQPSINGGASTQEQARQDMKELQAILQSGRLPAPIEIETISTISSSLGDEFMSAAVISIVASLIAVGGLVYLRYGTPKYVIPIVLTGSSEVFILIGTFFSTIITLDLASIAGIIAAVGTGVDDQIIITDESGREKLQDWTKRLKRAFFVIFTSAASTIGAMMPIVSPSLSNMAIGAAGIGLIGYNIYTKRPRPHHMMIGALAVVVSFVAFQFNPSAFALQSIRGFAVTTILGVLVGITITRPAYAKFVEYLDA